MRSGPRGSAPVIIGEINTAGKQISTRRFVIRPVYLKSGKGYIWSRRPPKFVPDGRGALL